MKALTISFGRVCGSILDEDRGAGLFHLPRLYERLREGELFAELAKYEFTKSELRYVGHIVGKHGLKVDPEKITVVKERPRPENSTDVT
jgi:hypothetical protein